MSYRKRGYGSKPQIIYVAKQSDNESETKITENENELNKAARDENSNKETLQKERKNEGKYNKYENYDRPEKNAREYGKGSRSETNRASKYSRKEKYEAYEEKKRPETKDKIEETKQDVEDLKIEEKTKMEIDNERNVKVIQPSKPKESSLIKILIDQFRYRKVECPICFNKIHDEARLWSCRQCYQPFHLDCISKWIRNTNASKKNEGPQLCNWNCPKCCFIYAEEMPRYFCFCGKTSNPEYDSYFLPHSCGEICNKVTITKCKHLCSMKCHPGPCPPCNLVEKRVSCFCAKKSFITKCSDDAENFSCSEPCSKPLSCKSHNCSLPCHPPPCPPCPITLTSLCFCGKSTQTKPCGTHGFSCLERCEKLLDCSNHTCERICHENKCEGCKFKPEVLKTCPCGKISLDSLMGKNARKSCLDKIDICGLICGKIMNCELHGCKRMCHLGECGECKEMVEQECRCGKKKRKIECWKSKKEIFLCEKICKKKKSCGSHACMEECCPAANRKDSEGSHLCLKICGKKLSCGSHNCDLFCHIGFCKPCPIFISNPISCTCGKTILYPPLPCGTKKPVCKLNCGRKRVCEHGCDWECHEDDCPPCSLLVDKACNCGRFLMKGVSCGKEVSCGEPCDIQIKCGHLCGQICHSDECLGLKPDFICEQKCEKVRSDCFHKCFSQCHYGQECPQDFCRVLKKLSCECRNRFEFTECGSFSKKMLKCDDNCKSRQRFGAVFESDLKRYSCSLVKFARSELSFLTKLEEKLQNFYKNTEDSAPLEISLKPLMGSKKILMLQNLIVIHYQMDIELYLHIKEPIAIILRTKNMKNPRPKLSYYYKDFESGVGISGEAILPFEAVVKFYASNVRNIMYEMEYMLRESKTNFVMEFNGDKVLNIHFWEYHEGELFSKKLKKKNYNFQFERNLKILLEQEKFSKVPGDIIDTPSPSENIDPDP